MDNYYVRLALLAIVLIKIEAAIIFVLAQAAVHPALVSGITAAVTALFVMYFLRKERAWRFMRPVQIAWVTKCTDLFYRFFPRPAKREPYRFTVRDKSISFLSPMQLHAIKSVQNTAQNAKLLRHEFYQTSDNYNLTISCEYALYSDESRPNVERLIEKRVREYTESDPSAAGKYLVSMLYDHEGIETYLLNGCFIREREQYEYRAAYFHSGSRFWCIHIQYPARNRNGSTRSMRLLGSVAFNFELPYTEVGNLDALTYEPVTMDSGTITFRSPFELYKHNPKIESESRYWVTRQEHFTSVSSCNMVLECGFRELGTGRKVKLDEVVDETVSLFADYYHVPAREIRHIRLNEFQVEGRWLQGVLSHNFHSWHFHHVVFAVGGHSWYLRLRYYANLEGGYEAFETILDSIRFDQGTLDSIIDQMLDNLNKGNKNHS